jgi:hypothetical protein
VRSRPASTIRPAPAALLRPVPATRWSFPSAGACLTRHHRGFIRIHPSALPQPVPLGWDEGPWALASGFAPRGYPRRTLRWGQALHTAWDPPLDSSRVSLVASTPLKRPHVASARSNSPGCPRPPRPTLDRVRGHQVVSTSPDDRPIFIGRGWARPAHAALLTVPHHPPGMPLSSATSRQHPRVLPRGCCAPTGAERTPVA